MTMIVLNHYEVCMCMMISLWYAVNTQYGIDLYVQ